MLTVSHTLYDDSDEGSEVVVFPAHYEVCDRCRGTGKHVNPNVDGNGISGEEFDADPDFREAYFSGAYDVQCSVCNGLRVVAVMNAATDLSPELQAKLELLFVQWEYEAMERREAAAERAMGA